MCRPGGTHEAWVTDMKGSSAFRFVLLLMAWATLPVWTAAQSGQVLPSPLSLGDVVRIAGERRDEIQAARARARAGEARPTIVSALADPMISPALDHLPFILGGADVSVTIEQQSRYRASAGIVVPRRWRISIGCGPTRAEPYSTSACRLRTPS